MYKKILISTFLLFLLVSCGFKDIKDSEKIIDNTNNGAIINTTSETDTLGEALKGTSAGQQVSGGFSN